MSITHVAAHGCPPLSVCFPSPHLDLRSFCCSVVCSVLLFCRCCLCNNTNAPFIAVVVAAIVYFALSDPAAAAAVGSFLERSFLPQLRSFNQPSRSFQNLEAFRFGDLSIYVSIFAYFFGRRHCLKQNFTPSQSLSLRFI